MYILKEELHTNEKLRKVAKDYGCGMSKDGLPFKGRHTKFAISYSCLGTAFTIKGRSPFHSSQLFVQASKVATNSSVVRYCGNLLPSLPQTQVIKTGIRMRSLKGTRLYHGKNIYSFQYLQTCFVLYLTVQ